MSWWPASTKRRRGARGSRSSTGDGPGRRRPLTRLSAFRDAIEILGEEQAHLRVFEGYLGLYAGARESSTLDAGPR